MKKIILLSFCINAALQASQQSQRSCVSRFLCGMQHGPAVTVQANIIEDQLSVSVMQAEQVEIISTGMSIMRAIPVVRAERTEIRTNVLCDMLDERQNQVSQLQTEVNGLQQQVRILREENARLRSLNSELAVSVEESKD